MSHVLSELLLSKCLYFFCLSILAFGPACRSRHAVRDEQPSVSASKTHPYPSSNVPKETNLPGMRSSWNPSNGRGEVLSVLDNGDHFVTCFHCRYDGYTGGLVIGSMDDSGTKLIPNKPIRGFRSLNIWCAQDESIWDRNERAEYTYGWSENFGRGDDGKRLGYVQGRVIEASSDRVVLQTQNEGGCYRITKVAYSRSGVPWWIIATRIVNRCDHPVHFDFWTGEDPWIGQYRSADGDVGWYAGGLVRGEAEVVPSAFRAGGLYDLGNEQLGQKEGTFSNVANFIEVDPAVPLVKRILFANRFAHSRSEIKLDKPLDNKSIIAFNLGWVDETLAPGHGLTLAVAMGIAHTFEAGTTPRPWEVEDADWSVWRRYLTELDEPPSPICLDFAAERVKLDLEWSSMRVTGTYVFRNDCSSSTQATITYPIASDANHPAPSHIQIDSKPVPVQDGSATFPVSVAPLSVRRVEISYLQQHNTSNATYIVTSANRWPRPIGRAEFEISAPLEMGPIAITFPVHSSQRTQDRLVMRAAFAKFSPTKELVLRWRPKKGN